jgi:hypothetical protein
MKAPKEPIMEEEDEDEDKKVLGAFVFRDTDGEENEFIRGGAFIPVVCNYNRSKNNISVS